MKNSKTGTYADIVFSKESNKKFDDILKDFDLKKDFVDAYHCTLTYSKKYLPYLKTSKGVKQDKTGNAVSKFSKLVKIKEFGHFDTEDGKNLHVVLDCPWCKTQFNRAIKAGATTDYPSYTAHVTLMYNCKDFDLDIKKNQDIAKKWIGSTIEIVEERISPLNKNWVEDKTIEESSTRLLKRTPYELNMIIKNLRNDAQAKDKILNDPKKLENRLKNLNQISNPTKKEQTLKKKLQKDISLPAKAIGNYENSDLITIETLKKKFNLKKIKQIGQGYTTFVFDDPINKKHVLCFTLDEDKIKWMQANKKLFEFTMIDEAPYDKTNKLYIYSIKKFIKTMDNHKMSKYNQQLIWDEVVAKYGDLLEKKGYFNVKVKELDYIMHTITNKELLNILQLLKKTFSDDKSLDLHEGQWGEDNKGNIILFDPIISQKVINKLDLFNDLEISTKFALFVDKLFNLTSKDNEYINRVKKVLQKG